jgi:hypothetical protein
MLGEIVKVDPRPKPFEATETVLLNDALGDIQTCPLP